MSRNQKRKKLLSQREKALVEDKDNFSERRIKDKILLFRKLRNKYRDLAKRQKIAQRGSAAAETSSVGQGESNTVKKAAFFSEALDHFEQRLKNLYGSSEPMEDDYPRPKALRNPGVTPAAIAETAALGNDHELASEKEKKRQSRIA